MRCVISESTLLFGTSGTKDPQELLAQLLDHNSLSSAFVAKIAPSQLRGIDRLSPDQFNRNLSEQVEIIQRKCSNASYRFSPYLESLRLKSRDKLPRVIALATVRDRLVLHQLKELLHLVFPECVARKLPNQYIREIRDFQSINEGLSTVRADIRSFYDRINHKILFEILESRLPKNILRLLIKAVRNPIISYKKRSIGDRSLRKIGEGVPQGLAISNILAEIYLHELEEDIIESVQFYLRYVDDILLFTKFGQEEAFYQQLKQAFKNVGLDLADEKSSVAKPGECFEYLGYDVESSDISIRKTTVDRFIDSLAAHFASFKYQSDPRYRAPWLDAEAHVRIFLDELNERITGAISGNRRYGWLFYFLEITDLKQLYEIDAAIQRLWERFIDSNIPHSLKRLVRAYYEAKFNQHGGYIHNYNQYSTLRDKMKFLQYRGFVDPEAETRYTEDNIEHMYARLQYNSISRLEADVGTIS